MNARQERTLYNNSFTITRDYASDLSESALFIGISLLQTTYLLNFLEKTTNSYNNNMTSIIFEDELEKKVLDEVHFEGYENTADVQAQVNLGVCYSNGTGVEKDEQKAVELYQKAAEQGDANAQYNLGWCYESGTAVEKDEQKAVEWYKKAAEQGYASQISQLQSRLANLQVSDQQAQILQSACETPGPSRTRPDTDQN